MALTCILTSLTTLLCLFIFCVDAATNKEFLQMGQVLRTSDTILSDGGNFELGFFSRVNSTKYYVGIWYKKAPNDKIVWVANRDYALPTSSAVLTMQPDGNLVIIDGQETYRVNEASNNVSTYATLLDSGNLVLLNTSNQAILWQSFDNPTDTILPGMNTGLLRSWKNADNPASGAFSLVYGSGSAEIITHNVSNVSLSSSETYNVFEQFLTLAAAVNNSRLILEVSGKLNTEYWSEKANRWVSIESSKCGNDSSCGDFSICNSQAHDPCSCLQGFKPSDADSWGLGDKSSGCVRKTELSSCNNSVRSNDKFTQLFKVQFLSYPDEYTKVDTPSGCESICSCVAYTYNLSNGDCQWWMGSLFNVANC